MKNSWRLTLFVTAAAFAFPALAQPSDAPAQVTLTVVETRAPSTYLADGEGQTLYVLVTDGQGGETTITASGGASGGDTAENLSALPCEGECASAWPPLVVAEGGDEAVQAGDQVDAAQVGTTTRADGSIQVTYNGYPLYYFVQDESPGNTSGQAVESFGGVWYTLSPDGEPIVADTSSAN